MTSSLVGSEMCIRDRNCRPISCPSRVECAAGPTRSSRRWRMILPPLSVSYTHLTLPTICSV
eukprot:3863017-Prorocentrum_lima.AAC.1